MLQGLHAQNWHVRAIDVTGVDSIRTSYQVSSIPLHRVTWVAARSPLRYRQDLLLNLGNFSFDILSAPRLGRPDVFYGFSMASLRSLRRARRAGVLSVLLAAPTYVPSVRAILEKEYSRLGAGRQPFNDSATTRAVAEYHEADLIRAESQLTRQSLVDGNVPDEKIFVLPPSVDLETFRPAERSPQSFTVAFVGGFNIRKGLHHLLAAWDLVGRDDDRLVLHGGGDGWADRMVAPYRARTNVSFRMGSPHQTLRAASVCVCPSLEDAFCNVALEAMATGVPVIISDQVGAKDLIREGSEGYILRAGDVEGIAERISHLRDHSAERQRMGSAARRQAESCTLENEGRELNRVLHTALERL